MTERLQSGHIWSEGIANWFIDQFGVTVMEHSSPTIESDQENSFESQFEPRFTSVRANFRNSPSLPPCKGRLKMREQTKHKNSTGSTSGFSSSGSLTTDMSESNSDIFYIYNPVISIDSNKEHSSHDQQTCRDRYKKSRFRSRAQLDLGQLASKQVELISPQSSPLTSISETIGYMKHSNLEVCELTFQERVHLARIHYLTIPNGIRLALVLFCLGWFIFNAYTILKEYTEYGTVVYMEYRPPKFTGPPAISICTHCILCSYSNKVLEQVNVIDVVSHNESDIAMYSLVEDSISLEMNDISIQCSYQSSTVPSLKNKVIADCKNVVPVVVSLQEGRKCFTLFSDIQGQMTRANLSNNGRYELEYERFPMIKVTIGGKLLTNPPAEVLLPDDMTNNSKVDSAAKKASKANSGLFIALHDPTLLSYMHDIPMHRIQSGKNIDVRFEKKIELLKEPPYSTNCFNYPNLLEVKPNQSDPSSIFGRYTTTRSGLAIYRSRGECFLYCIWRTLNTGRCVNIYSIFLIDMVEPAELYWQRILGEGRVNQLNWNALNEKGKLRFCSRTNRSLSEYLYYKQQCLNQCNQACRVESFSMDSNILDNEGQNENMTTIFIQWAPDPFIFISHKEKLDLNEFLGALGGHAHIWLGLSVIHIIRYLINLVKTGEFLPETSCCCIIYWWKSFVRSRKSSQHN